MHIAPAARATWQPVVRFPAEFKAGLHAYVFGYIIDSHEPLIPGICYLIVFVDLMPLEAGNASAVRLQLILRISGGLDLTGAYRRISSHDRCIEAIQAHLHAALLGEFMVVKESGANVILVIADGLAVIDALS